MTLMAMCDPNSGLMDIPLSFILKNTLQLDATQVSRLRLLAAIPLYLSFLFGLARDNWSPFRLGDRGHFMVFGILSAATYAAFAYIPTSAVSLLAAILLLTVWSLFIASAQNGLASTIGQQHAMTGQISTVWNVFTALPAILAFLIGGQISHWLDGMEAQSATRDLFLVGAVTSFALFLFALLCPALHHPVAREHDRRAHPLADLKRLASHRPARIALLIWTLWNFAPGSATPLQFYLTDTVGGSVVQWGEWNAIFTASFIPTFLLFGVLCTRVSLSRLLWWGTIVAIPQYGVLLIVHTLQATMIAAIPIGLLGGLATAAYVDLTMRSAPSGLQGTMMMSASAVYFLATRIGDVLGSAVYDASGSFAVCVALNTAAYAAILLVLTRIPRDADVP